MSRRTSPGGPHLEHLPSPVWTAWHAHLYDTPLILIQSVTHNTGQHLLHRTHVCILHSHLVVCCREPPSPTPKWFQWLLDARGMAVTQARAFSGSQCVLCERATVTSDAMGWAPWREMLGTKGAHHLHFSRPCLPDVPQPHAPSQGQALSRPAPPAAVPTAVPSRWRNKGHPTESHLPSGSRVWVSRHMCGHLEWPVQVLG